MSRKNIQYIRAEGDVELVLCRDRPRAYPWHFHARHWAFGLVRAGSVTVTTLAGSFPLTTGGTFAIPPLAPHRLNIWARSSLAVLCTFDPSGINNPLAGIPHSGADKELAVWLEHPSAEPAVAVDAPSVDEASPVGAVRRLLAAQPGGRFPLKAIARLAGYSPSYFLRAFKQKTGLTPHAFQLICRVSLARGLLRAGVSAAEAAASSGFADQSHLHKAFKLHHGLTPGQFSTASVMPKQ